MKNSGKATKKHPVSVIQHPSGQPKQIALFDSHVIGTKDDFIFYTADTMSGSSGSPVFSEHWNLVALHHKTVPDFHRPLKFVANRGIRISAIWKRLESIRESDDDSARRSMAAEVIRQLSADDVSRSRLPVPSRSAFVNLSLIHI